MKNTFEEIKAQISTSGSDGFIASLRNSLLSRKVEVEGRALIDDQGTMILAERMEINQSPISDSANNVMEKWGLEI